MTADSEAAATGASQIMKVGVIKQVTFQGERAFGLSGPSRVKGLPQWGQRSGGLAAWRLPNADGESSARLRDEGAVAAASACRAWINRWR